MVFNIGFIFCVFGMLYVTCKTFETRSILSPQMFVFAGLLLFLYLPALANEFPYVTDDAYNLVLLFGVLGAFYGSNKVSYDILSTDKECYFLRPKIFKFIAYVYICILCYEIVEKVISMGSIMAVFMSNRIEAYLGESLTTNSSAFKSLFFEGFKICFFIWIDYLYSNEKKRNAIILFLFPLVHHMFTANTRFDFVAMLGAFIIYVMNKRMYITRYDTTGVARLVRKKINIRKVLLIGVIGGYCALIFMRAANYIRHGYVMDDLKLSPKSLILDTFSDDSNYYEFLYKLYETLEFDQFEYGFGWIIAPIINFIPRMFWPAKPYTSFSVRGTELVYYDYTSGNPVCTFTILGEGFGQFGLIGCFLAPIVLLLCRNINFKQLSSIKYHQLYSLVILFSLLTYMRAEVPIFWVIIDVFWILLIKKYLMTKKN